MTEEMAKHLSDAELAIFETHPHPRASLAQFDGKVVAAVMGLLASIPETGGRLPTGQSAFLLNELEKGGLHGE